MKTIKLPYRFIEDCQECDVDVGTYASGRLTATPEQLDNLLQRARYYADDSMDACPAGLIRAAKTVVEKLGAVR